MMHVAAQSDQVAVLYYLKNTLHHPVQILDFSKSTPLHWSCYSGAINVISFLLAWSSDLNWRDSNGMTALHLAVDNVEKIGDVSLIR
jgi:ankyrin repeat protein